MLKLDNCVMPASETLTSNIPPLAIPNATMSDYIDHNAPVLRSKSTDY